LNKDIELREYFLNENIFRYSPIVKTDVLIKLRSQKFTNKELRFLSYWGIGYKHKLDEIDINAIKFQKQWMDNLSEILGLDYRIQYIITDTHAKINNIPFKIIDSYSQSLIDYTKHSKIDVIQSSTLLKRYGIFDIFEHIKKYNIDSLLENSSYKSIMRGLEKQSKSYENRGDPLDYFKCNMIENAIIEEEYSKYIFVTYGVPETKFLLPNLPKIYTYVDKKRQIKRPWFNEGKQ